LQFGSTTELKLDLQAAGDMVNDLVETPGFSVNRTDWSRNYVNLPPLSVTMEQNYLAGAAGIIPSPDWFTNFYLMDTVNEQTQTFYDNFTIRTYLWDAGTDSAEQFMSKNGSPDAMNVVTRISIETNSRTVFRAPKDSEVRSVAEWQCVLHTCPSDKPDCEKEDWPPRANRIGSNNDY
jgi:hypothetical protein